MKKIFFFILMAILSKSLTAQTLEYYLKLEKIDDSKNIVYQFDNKIIFSNKNIQPNIQYKDIIKKIIKKMRSYEKQYKNEELYFMNSTKDTKNNIWTYNIRVKSNDISICSFLSKQNNYTVSGWISNDNKDIFGLRIFNF